MPTRFFSSNGISRMVLFRHVPSEACPGFNAVLQDEDIFFLQAQKVQSEPCFHRLCRVHLERFNWVSPPPSDSAKIVLPLNAYSKKSTRNEAPEWFLLKTAAVVNVVLFDQPCADFFNHSHCATPPLQKQLEIPSRATAVFGGRVHRGPSRHQQLDHGGMATLSRQMQGRLASGAGDAIGMAAAAAGCRPETERYSWDVSLGGWAKCG